MKAWIGSPIRCEHDHPFSLVPTTGQVLCPPSQANFGVPGSFVSDHQSVATRQEATLSRAFGKLAILLLGIVIVAPYLFFLSCTTAEEIFLSRNQELRQRASDTNKAAAPFPGTEKPPALLHQTNIQYVGAFRVPNYYNSVDEMSYGGGALAFNPVNKSLFIVGHRQAVAEISIPETILHSKDLGKLSTAKVLQEWVQILPGLPVKLAGATDGEFIGGLLVDKEQLIGTDYAYYSGANKQTTSHFVLSSLKLTEAKVGGLYQVGGLGGRYVAGYMTAIPNDWQTALGAPYLTGQADIPIINTSSSGPSAFGFDSKALGPKVAPATPYVYYPVDKPLGPYTGVINPLQNGTTSVTGAVFVPGTRTVLFFGTTGVNFIGYGNPEVFGDTVHGGKGPHSLNGQYAFQIWAYDASDFVAVIQGKVKPWQVLPFDVWNFDLPLPGDYVPGGAAFDASTGRIFLSVMHADREAAHSSLPLIEVFQVNLKVAVSAHPHIGTLSVTRNDYNHKDPNAFPSPGPIPAGTFVVLTAGNVYSVNKASVAKVKFYLDKVGGKQLGNGTPSSSLNAKHNWSLVISTADMPQGMHNIVCQAEDSEGLLSEPIATTLTLVPPTLFRMRDPPGD